MKVFDIYEVPITKLDEFLADHIDQFVKIVKVEPNNATFKIEQDYTEPELHMFHLRKFIESGDATPEEQNAAEYAINAIKTLMDMGVLK